MTRRRRLRLPPLLEHATFRRFWAGQCTSLVGDEVTLVALPLLGVLTLDLDAAELGMLTAAGLAPNLLLALQIGVWVDRAGRRRATMMVADLARAALLGVLAASALAGTLDVGHLYAGALLLGVLSVAFNVSYSALFVTLVPRDAYVAAGQLLQGARALAAVGGPSLAGVLVQVAGAPAALLASAGGFLVSALTLRGIRPAEAPPQARARGDLTDGLRFIARSPYVRPTLAAIATSSFALAGVRVLLVLYALRELGLSPGALGAILGVGALGAVAGALLAGRIVRRVGVGAATVWGVVGLPAFCLSVPLADGPPAGVAAILLAGQVGAGFFALLFDVAAGALLAAAIPAQIRARVQGAFMFVNYGVRPLGALAAGAIGGLLGLRASLLALALLGMLGTPFLLCSRVRRLRTIDDIVLPSRDRGVSAGTGA